MQRSPLSTTLCHVFCRAASLPAKLMFETIQSKRILHGGRHTLQPRVMCLHRRRMTASTPHECMRYRLYSLDFFE